MTKLDRYMQDPSIVSEPMPLREVHAIRLMIYDDIKDMATSEINNYYKRGFEEVQKRHGFKVEVLKKPHVV